MQEKNEMEIEGIPPVEHNNTNNTWTNEDNKVEEKLVKAIIEGKPVDKQID